ncbi:hypothetical protein CYMTET_8336 [Cymbomonas tetramitiformis]|uniref:Uncharacterized protein n=1 Tax=Cymbomonas tetramitiformis TaxID=36881 RepID=A0AAE0GTQ1_9CHLO|nr:hypothetical protein CYMTET_8336 [Cymbomonas tetramitiformis]
MKTDIFNGEIKGLLQDYGRMVNEQHFQNYYHYRQRSGWLPVEKRITIHVWKKPLQFMDQLHAGESLGYPNVTASRNIFRDIKEMEVP